MARCLPPGMSRHSEAGYLPQGGTNRKLCCLGGPRRTFPRSLKWYREPSEMQRGTKGIRSDPTENHCGMQDSPQPFPPGKALLSPNRKLQNPTLPWLHPGKLGRVDGQIFLPLDTTQTGFNDFDVPLPTQYFEVPTGRWNSHTDGGTLSATGKDSLSPIQA